MFLSNKIKEYFKENKDKSKAEVIKDLVAMGYKESTAITYYSNKKENIINQRKVAFDFFAANPDALVDTDNKLHAKSLGMVLNTYAIYKVDYRAQMQKENLRFILAEKEKKVPLYGEKYFKGRLRQKFSIDDSNL